MKKILLILPILLCTAVKGTSVEVDSSSLHMPSDCGSCKVHYDQEGFFVSRNNNEYRVQSHQLDSQLRKIVEKDQLASFLKKGYLSIKEGSEGSFSIESHGRLIGGGPIVGLLAWAAIKTTSLVVMPVNPAVGMAIFMSATPVSAALIMTPSP